MRIDHVIYGTADLDRAAARVQAELGLTAVPGGRHEGLGTHNRLVPLADGTFLELLAVADPEEAARSPMGSVLQARLQRGDGLLGWAVAVDDVEAVGGEITTVGRQGMTARLAGVAEALAEPCLPFFIERPELRPATEIDWIEVAGDAGRIDRWLRGAALPVRVVPGEPAVRAVSIGGRELR